MKKVILKHHTCPFCNKEVLSKVVNPYHLYKSCPNCGEANKELEYNERDEHQEDIALYLFLIGEAV